MKISIITASHLRKNVLKLFFLSMDRLRNESGIDIDVICVGDQDQKTMADKHDIHFIPMPNKPVSRKFQKALTTAKSYSPDGVLILGSDDIISTQTINNLSSGLDEVDVSGLSLIYFYSTLPDTAGMLLEMQRGYMFGAGKMIGGELLNKLNWVLWEKDANFGLDGMAIKRMQAIPYTHTISCGTLVDVKSRINMNKFSFWQKKLYSVDPYIFLDILSERERQQLEIIKSREVL